MQQNRKNAKGMNTFARHCKHLFLTLRALTTLICQGDPQGGYVLRSPQKTCKSFKRVNPRKAVGPDGIPSRNLRADVFSDIFISLA